jgi:Niemann-Pick C1 protein
MFLYISLALGKRIRDPLNSRFLLGLICIFIIGLSVFAASGTTFYWNMKLTPFTAEVIPYLMLALGLDNFFILADAERVLPKYVTRVEKRIALALKETGPAIFISSTC